MARRAWVVGDLTLGPVVYGDLGESFNAGGTQRGGSGSCANSPGSGSCTISYTGSLVYR